MKKKRHSVEHVMGILLQAEGGQAVQEFCRKNKISEQTLYHWKRWYGGMLVYEAQRTKQRKGENRRLKNVVAEQALHIQVLKEVNSKNGKPVAEAKRNRSRPVSGTVFVAAGV